MDKFHDALSKSAQDFLTCVYPHIKDWFGQAILKPVEAVTNNEMADMLDRLSGIDAWIIETKKGIRGLASRVQYDSTFETFTVRKERETGARTEYEKLSYAIKHDCLYPFWFCHAYLQTNPKELTNVALCKTLDLVDIISNGKERIDYDIRQAGKFGCSTFYAVKWDRFQELDKFIQRYSIFDENLKVMELKS